MLRSTMATQRDGYIAPTGDELQSIFCKDSNEIFSNYTAEQLLEELMLDVSQDSKSLIIDSNVKPRIFIKESDKCRGKPYLCNDRHLTVSDYAPVCFMLTGGQPGWQINAWLSFEDEECLHIPVTCNKCPHEKYKKCSSLTDHSEANFCIISADVAVNYEKLNGHPTAVMKLDKSTDVKMMMSFKCLISCAELTQHTRSNRVVHIELTNHKGECEALVEWSLRVCKGIRRDHMQRLGMGIKRKLEDEHIAVVKKAHAEEEPYVHFINNDDCVHNETVTRYEPIVGMKMKPEACVSYPPIQYEPAVHSAAVAGSAPHTMVVKMKNEQNHSLVLKLIKKFGGEVEVLKDQGNQNLVFELVKNLGEEVL